MRDDTILVNGGYAAKRHNKSIIPPIYQAVNFRYDTAEEIAAVFAHQTPGHIYSRVSNPTVEILERRMTQLEDGLGAVATVSGMSAITAVTLGLAAAGGKVLSGTSLFGSTAVLFEKVYRQYGIESDFFNPSDAEAARNKIDDRTRFIFVESTGNPRLDIPDIKALVSIGNEHGIPVVLDATLNPPVGWKPGSLGVAVVVYSTTKYLTGNATTIGGMIVDTGVFDWNQDRLDPVLGDLVSKTGQAAFISYLKTRFIREMGFTQTPLGAYMVLLGMETLGLRYRRTCANAFSLAERLSSHNAIESFNYPGLPDHPQHNLVKTQFGGLGNGLFTFFLGTRERCFKFLNSLRQVAIATNLGDSRTLALHPRSTIYSMFTDEEALKAGVTDDMIRVSVGIEDPEDLVTDFERALDALDS